MSKAKNTVAAIVVVWSFALLSACGDKSSGSSSTPKESLSPAAQIDMPPLAAGDPDLVLDLDFRLGPSAIDRVLTSAYPNGEGLTHDSTGESWDPTLGWNPGPTGRYYTVSGWKPSLPSLGGNRANIGDSFTIYFEVQRSAIASTVADNNSSLLDCSDGPSGTVPNGSIYTIPTQGYVFQFGNHSLGYYSIASYYNVTGSGTAPVGRFITENRETVGSGKGQLALAFNCDYLNSEDGFVKFTIVVDGLQEYYYIDGLLRKIYLRTDLANTTDDIFDSLRFADNGAGNVGLKGYIRRFQLIKRTCQAKSFHGPRIAVTGDSFVVRGAGQPDPTGPTIPEIDQVQNMLDDSKLSTLNNPVIGPWYTPMIWTLQKEAAKLGARFPFYAAGDSGHGWSSTATGGTAQIRQGFFDATANYDPEIWIAVGSVNDINSASPPADLVAETKERLAYTAAKCRNLRKILFVQTFPAYKGDSTRSSTAQIAEYKRQIALQLQLNGFAVATADGRTVTVQVVPTYDALGGDNYNAKFNLGGSPEAALWDAFYPAHPGPNPYPMHDVHSGQYGQNRQAEIIWAALKPYVVNPAIY